MGYAERLALGTWNRRGAWHEVKLVLSSADGDATEEEMSKSDRLILHSNFWDARVRAGGGGDPIRRARGWQVVPNQLDREPVALAPEPASVQSPRP